MKKNNQNNNQNQSRKALEKMDLNFFKQITGSPCKAARKAAIHFDDYSINSEASPKK
jgi:hypothetical protein